MLAVYDRETAARGGPLRSYINSIGYEYFFGHYVAAPPLPHMADVREGNAEMRVLDLVDMIRGYCAMLMNRLPGRYP